jgi:hypothetical protein
LYYVIPVCNIGIPVTFLGHEYTKQEKQTLNPLYSKQIQASALVTVIWYYTIQHTAYHILKTSRIPTFILSTRQRSEPNYAAYMYMHVMFEYPIFIYVFSPPEPEHPWNKKKK